MNIMNINENVHLSNKIYNNLYIFGVDGVISDAFDQWSDRPN